MMSQGRVFAGMKRRLANTNVDEAIDAAKVALSLRGGLSFGRIAIGQQCDTAYPTDQYRADNSFIGTQPTRIQKQYCRDQSKPDRQTHGVKAGGEAA